MESAEGAEIAEKTQLDRLSCEWERKADSPQRRRDAEKDKRKEELESAEGAEIAEKTQSDKLSCEWERKALAGAPGADWASAFWFVSFSASLRLCGEDGAF